MELLGRGKVTGYKWWVGPSETGGTIDAGTIFIESDLKNSQHAGGFGAGGDKGQGFSRGFASSAFKCINADVVKKIQGIETPFVAEFVIESQTDGKGAKTEVLMHIKPLQEKEKKAA